MNTELRDYQKTQLNAWYFTGHMAKCGRGTRVHYVVRNRRTGEELNTYRQVKKARELVRLLNKAECRMIAGAKLCERTSIIKAMCDITARS